MSDLPNDVSTFLADARCSAAWFSRITLSDISVSPQHVRIVERVVGEYPNVYTVTFDHVSFVDDSLRVFATFLATNTTLTTIEIAPDGYKCDVTPVGEALATNSSITRFVVARVAIDVACASAISKALEAGTSLTNLEFKAATFDPASAVLIGKALKTSGTLTRLAIRTCQFDSDGASAIAEALKTNKVLTMLDLQWNCIDEVGAGAIADALRTNNTLEALMLYHNRFGSDGVRVLAEALIVNSSIKRFSVGHFLVDSACAGAVAAMLR